MRLLKIDNDYVNLDLVQQILIRTHEKEDMFRVFFYFTDEQYANYELHEDNKKELLLALGESNIASCWVGSLG